MTRHVLFASRSTTSPGPRLSVGWSLAFSVIAHLLSIALLALATGEGKQPGAPGKPQRKDDRTPVSVVHVFVPAAGRPVKAPSMRQMRTPRELTPGVPAQVDLTRTQLGVETTPEELLAALEHWHGAFGIATDPAHEKLLSMTLGVSGDVLGDEPVSLDAFWAIEVNDMSLRDRFGVLPGQLLYALFPIDMVLAVEEAVAAAVRANSLNGPVHVVRANYTFSTLRGYRPTVTPASLEIGR